MMVECRCIGTYDVQLHHPVQPLAMFQHQCMRAVLSSEICSCDYVEDLLKGKLSQCDTQADNLWIYHRRIFHCIHLRSNVGTSLYHNATCCVGISQKQCC